MGFDITSSEHPDVFGLYFNGIGLIHNNILHVLKKMDYVNTETEMHILQCNYREYLDYGHDKNYEWIRFYFKDNKTKDFAVGFNRINFKNNENDMELIVFAILKTWNEISGSQVKIDKKIDSLEELEKSDDEMILSVHFWFDKKYSKKNIEDTQYCKIVYTYSSLSDYLEKIRLTTAST